MKQTKETEIKHFIKLIKDDVFIPIDEPLTIEYALGLITEENA